MFEKRSPTKKKYDSRRQKSRRRDESRSISQGEQSYYRGSRGNDFEEIDSQFNSDIESEESTPQVKSTAPKKIFDYDIFFENDQKNIILEDKQAFQTSVKEVSQIESIQIDQSFTIPDLKGVLIKFIDPNESSKHKALLQALKFVYDKVQNKDKFYTVCLIPNAMVSLVIGIRGKQINLINLQSGAKVIANQPISKMSQRTIRIEGGYNEVAKGVRLIYQLIEEKSGQVLEIEKEPSFVNLLEQETIARYVVPYQIKKYIDQRRDFLRWLDRENNVSLKFYEDQKHRHLRKTDVVCSLKGKLQDLIQTSKRFIQTVDKYIVENPREEVDNYFRVLIPNKYVTKLIGAGGCMVKDISAKSNGAHIKVISDKMKDKDQKECLISIGGSLGQKIDACGLILQQLEIFKNGGPVLLSGKNIYDNLVSQCKNSIEDNEQSQKTEYKRESYSRDTPHLDNHNKREGFSTKIEPLKGEGLSSKREGFSEGFSSKGFNDGSNDQSKRNRKYASPIRKKTKSPSRSRSRSKLRKHKKDKDSSRERESSKKIGIDDYEGKVKILIPIKIALKLEAQQTLQNISKLSRCRKIYFEEDSSERVSEKRLVIRGTCEQNKQAFTLLQKQIFYEEMEN